MVTKRIFWWHKKYFQYNLRNVAAKVGTAGRRGGVELGKGQDREMVEGVGRRFRRGEGKGEGGGAAAQAI